MARFFRTAERRQGFLLPVVMQDWLPEDDIVHLIVDAVSLMDLREFEAAHRLGGAGQAPFAPRMLLAVLIYAYSHGVRSSRAIERLCGRDAGYRFLVAEHVPDHTVIARFRRRHVDKLEAIFIRVLEMCRDAGLIRLGLVVLDGTKVKANAALEANRSGATIGEQIGRMLAEAETVDVGEDRLSRLRACKAELERRAAEAAARQQGKIAARAAEERASGKRRRGRKPKAADPDANPDRVANPTDPDSAIMKTRRGWVQGYNAQAVVTPEQIILAAEVTTEANDVRQLVPMLDRAQAAVEVVMGEDATLGAAVADAGYWSEANADSQTEECELFIATRKDREQRAGLRDATPPRGRIPKGLSARGRMERKLRTERGRAIYRRRGASVEPVFGQMKERQGAGRFSMRGLDQCRGEWHLHAAVHNLGKLHRESVRRAGEAGDRRRGGHRGTRKAA